MISIMRIHNDLCFFLIQVKNIPTVIGVKNGKVQDKFLGYQDDDIVNSFVEKLL